MSLSRGVGLFKRFNKLSKPVQQIRLAGGGDERWNYRTLGLEGISKEAKYVGDFMMGVFFWWFLYNIYHNHGHIIGEWPEYPDPSKWTDADLGIPPDDAD